jgi:hypothetical protein
MHDLGVVETLESLKNLHEVTPNDVFFEMRPLPFEFPDLIRKISAADELHD